MKGKKSLKSMKIRTVIVFVVVFIIINSFAQCDQPASSDALEVACDVPNDRWYVEIIPNWG